MAYGESNGYVTDDVTNVAPEGKTRDPNTLRAHGISRKQLEMLFSNNRYRWSARRQYIRSAT